MRKTEKSPKKREIPFAVAMAKWPDWMPRPAPQPAPEKTLPAPSEDADINFESELPSVAELLGQAKQPKIRVSRPDETLAEQVRLIKMIGRRMRESREELAGFSQIEAAKLLGYSNSSKLAKIEGATDTNSVPLLTILRAAQVYEVSIDFLFGVADDWERDPQLCRERAIGRWLYEHLDRARTRDVAIFAELAQRIEIATAQITQLANGAERASSAFDRFADINPTFPDLIGGARLQTSLSALDDAGRKARAALRRLNLDLGLERADAAETTNSKHKECHK